jgi:general stress protein 26
LASAGGGTGKTSQSEQNGRYSEQTFGRQTVQRENVRKLREVLQTLDAVMLTTVDDKHHLVSRPMAVRFDEFDGVVRLFAPKDSRCVAHIAARAWVNISDTSPTVSVSLAGMATLVTDRHRIARHWHDRLDPWLAASPVATTMIEVTVFEGRSWTMAVPADRLTRCAG